MHLLQKHELATLFDVENDLITSDDCCTAMQSKEHNISNTMSIQCKDQENDNEDIITTTSPYCTSTSTMNRNCLELHEGNSQSQHHTMSVDQEQSLDNTSIPNTIQVPRRHIMKQQMIQGERMQLKLIHIIMIIICSRIFYPYLFVHYF